MLLTEGASTVVGATLAIAAAVGSNLGVNVQKKSHVRNERLPIHKQRAYYVRPLWWLGMVLVVSGSLGDLFALGFASQTLVASLGGGSTIFANVILAHYWLKQPLFKTDIQGVCLVGVGVLIAAIASQPEGSFTASELWELWLEPTFIMYLLIVGSFILYLHHVTRRLSSVASIEDNCMPSHEADVRAEYGWSNSSPEAHAVGIELQEIKKPLSSRSPRNHRKVVDEANADEDADNYTTASDSQSDDEDAQGGLSTGVAGITELSRASKKGRTLEVVDLGPIDGPGALRLGSPMKISKSTPNRSAPTTWTEKGKVLVSEVAEKGKDVFDWSVERARGLIQYAKERAAEGRSGQQQQQQQQQVQQQSGDSRSRAADVEEGLRKKKINKGGRAQGSHGVTSVDGGHGGTSHIPPQGDRRQMDRRVPLFYAAMSGTLGAQSVLLAKCVMELVVTTMAGDNQFIYIGTYLFLIGVVFMLLSQTHTLNLATMHGDTMSTFPVFQAFWIGVSNISAIIYFQQAHTFSTYQWILWPLALTAMIHGIYLISKHESQVEGGSGDHASSSALYMVAMPLSISPTQQSQRFAFAELSAAEAERLEGGHSPMTHCNGIESLFGPNGLLPPGGRHSGGRKVEVERSMVEEKPQRFTIVSECDDDSDVDSDGSDDVPCISVQGSTRGRGRRGRLDSAENRPRKTTRNSFSAVDSHVLGVEVEGPRESTVSLVNGRISGLRPGREGFEGTHSGRRLHMRRSSWDGTPPAALFTVRFVDQATSPVGGEDAEKDTDKVDGGQRAKSVPGPALTTPHHGVSRSASDSQSYLEQTSPRTGARSGGNGRDSATCRASFQEEAVETSSTQPPSPQVAQVL